MSRITDRAKLAARRLWVSGAAIGLTLAVFLVLPLMQSISRGPETDTIVLAVDSVNLPPPPPPPAEDKPPEPPPEEDPPELMEESPPLDLSQLELALNPGLGGDWLAGDFAVRLGATASAQSDADALFSLADLDQKPRVLFQASPAIDASVRRKAPGTVYVIFVVDQRGRVENPMVQSATDPVFEGPALAAVKQWRFEPGKRNGQPVKFRMRVPMTFPKGQ